MNRKWLLVLLALVGMMLFSGCYWQSEVEADEIGIKLDDGISFSGTTGPGRYTNGGWFAELHKVNVAVQTVDWEDASLVTKDKQPIGLKLSLSYRRMGTEDAIQAAFAQYNSELFNNERLQTLVNSRVPDVAKGATALLTIDEMLYSRSSMADGIKESLAVELEKVYVELVSVNITNIALDPGYEAKLKEKALVIQDREIAQEAAKTAVENLAKTKAETEIKLELARRENLVNAELAKVYEHNDRFYALKRLELLANVIGPNDKVIYVPEGSDLSFIYNDGGGKVVPVE